MVNLPSTKVWTPHLRLAFGGTLGTPAVEVWANSLKFVPAAGVVPTADQLQSVANAAANPLHDWFSGLLTIISQTALLTYVKATWVQANGKQRDLNTALVDFAPPVPGQSNQPVIWEQSYCVTLRTGLKRGRAHSGRVYPPMSGRAPAVNSPYCDPTDAQNMGDNFAFLLTQLKTAIVAIIDPGSTTSGFAVVSPGDTVKGTTPEFAYITGTVVDQVCDIMHSRTNRVKRREGTTRALPYTGQ
jgi:hypothetical protein